MNEPSFAELAGRARLDGRALPTRALEQADVSSSTAYGLQAGLATWFENAGQGPVAGYKLGATTKTMQEYLGVSSPVYGRIMASSILEHDDTFRRESDIETGVECELAVRLGGDMPWREDPWELDEVAQFVEWIAPAIEIVENRYGDFTTTPLGPMIADDFFHRAAVVGPPSRDWHELDLPRMTARLFDGSSEVDTGSGFEVLGHPFASIAMLATLLAEEGVSLEDGQTIMTGSMIKTAWAGPGETRFEHRLSGLGVCAVRVSAAP